MFPIRDDNPQFLTPYATYAIIGLNVAVWAAIQGFGTTRPLLESICSFGLIPAQLLHSLPSGAAVSLGHFSCPPLTGAGWYKVLTSMFMHGGWMHIVGNMWFLWIFGNNVEDAMGSIRFVAFYLLCGLAAAAMQVAMGPDSTVPMIGASGAIGGVMGAYVVLYPRVNVHLLVLLPFFFTIVAVPAFFMLAYWLVLQLLSGFFSADSEGGVAFWAHVGGFVAGMLLIFVFRNRTLLDRHPYHGWSRPRAATRSWRPIDRRWRR